MILTIDATRLSRRSFRPLVRIRGWTTSPSLKLSHPLTTKSLVGVGPQLIFLLWYTGLLFMHYICRSDPMNTPQQKNYLPQAIENFSEAIRTSAIIQYILTGRPLHLTLEQPDPYKRKIRMDAADLRTGGNIDLSLLRQENQNPTHVTSHIANLAYGLFREQMIVVGQRTREVGRDVLKKRESAQFRRMKEYQRLTFLKTKGVKWRPEWAVDRNLGWFSKAEVGGTIYSVCICTLLLVFWSHTDVFFRSVTLSLSRRRT